MWIHTVYICVCVYLIHLQHVPVWHTRLKHYSKHYKQWVLSCWGSWQLSLIYWPPFCIPVRQWSRIHHWLVRQTPWPRGAGRTSKHLDGHCAQDKIIILEGDRSLLHGISPSEVVCESSQFDTAGHVVIKEDSSSFVVALDDGVQSLRTDAVAW